MPPALAVIAGAVLFGTTGTAQALGPDGTTPLGVGAARMMVGGAVLALLGTIARRARPGGDGRRARPLSWRAFALMGVAGVSLFAYNPLFFLGTAQNGVAVGTVISLGCAPVFTGAIEWAVTRHRPRLRWGIATALAAAGVALLTAPGEGGLSASGVAASLGAGLAFASFTNAQRTLLAAGLPPLAVMAVAGGIAAVCAIPVAATQDMSWLADPRGIAMALWLGLGSCALAYALFIRGLAGMRAADAATLTLAEPFVATVLGLVVLGERIVPSGVIGLTMLGAGIVVLAVRRRRAA